MTAEEVLETFVTMPREELQKLQSGIEQILANEFSPEEVSEIQEALNGPDAQFERGEFYSVDEIRAHFGVK